MIISFSHQFVFIHIHKCAGTSVAALLENYCSWKDISVGYNPYSEDFYRRQYGFHKHIYADELIDIIGMEEWKNYFTFSFVRNPYTRAVSLFTYFQRQYNNLGFKKKLPKFLTDNKAPFSFPVIKAIRETNSFSEFIRHDGFLNDYGCQPQSSFLTNPETGDILVDFVGTLENLSTDLEMIFNKLNLQYQNPEKLNISRRKTMDYYYRDPKDIEYIKQLYRSDFELFGYDIETIL